jgi:hypothetical protein
VIPCRSNSLLFSSTRPPQLNFSNPTFTQPNQFNRITHILVSFHSASNTGTAPPCSIPIGRGFTQTIPPSSDRENTGRYRKKSNTTLPCRSRPGISWIWISNSCCPSVSRGGPLPTGKGRLTRISDASPKSGVTLPSRYQPQFARMRS